MRADPQIINLCPEFQLAEAIGMRNMLINGYHDVKLDYVWETIQDELPVLKQQVRRLLLKLAKDEPTRENR